MRIVVFGATGATGRRAVDKALTDGHDVVAVVRRPEQVASRPRLLVRAGDVLDAASLGESCQGADAVVSCIGPRSNFRPGTVMSIGTTHMLAAAEAAGVRRFVLQSGIGLSDGTELSRASRLLLRVWHPLFAAALADKAAAEGVVRTSQIEWVIVRPTVLRDTPATGRFLAGPRAPVSPLAPLSYVDCADCLLRAVDDPAWTGQVVNLGRA